MTDEPQFLTAGSTPIRSDDPGWVPGVEFKGKRYLLPRPGGDPSELTPWTTRVTTLTGGLTSDEGLRIWTERAIMHGIGMRPDLRAALASAPDDKDVQDEVREAAKVAAGTDAPARYGRAVHRAIEALTASGDGQCSASPTEDIGRDALAAVSCLQRNNITVQAVEQVVVHETLEYAGRLDALWKVTLPDGRTVLRVGDIKTGKVASADKRRVMGAQLAAYVNATHFYNPTNRSFTPLRATLFPAELDSTTGYILHVQDGVAQLYEIDLLTGWVGMLTAVKRHGLPAPQMLPVGEFYWLMANEEPAADGSDVAPAPSPSARSGAERVETIVLDDVPTETPDKTLTDRAADRMTGGAGRAIEALTGPVVQDAQSVPTASVSLDPPERTASGRRRRTCSICRQPGHTAKTCKSKNPQPDPQPVDEEPSGPSTPRTVDDVVTQRRVCDCGARDGWGTPSWTSRPDVFACARCDLPSQATLDRLLGEQGLLTEYRLDPDEGKRKHLIDQIHQARSQEELGQLWLGNQGWWTSEHTAIASQLVRNGLPLIPPQA